MEQTSNKPGEESAPRQLAAMPEWKQELLRSLFAMVEALPDEEPPKPSPSENSSDLTAPLPTLEEFYKALVALEANTRKNVQKTNATLETVAKSLRALQRQMSQVEENKHSASSADPTLWLMLDSQLRRMLDRMKNPPAPTPLGLSRKWQIAWTEIANGAQIIQHSLAKILDEQGVRSHSPAPGASFDPACMEAVKVSSRPPAAPAEQAQVLEVIEPAYYQKEKLIRAARVHVQR